MEFPTIFNKSCTYITFKSAVKQRQLLSRNKVFIILPKKWLYENNYVGHDADTPLIHMFGRRVGRTPRHPVEEPLKYDLGVRGRNSIAQSSFT